MFFFNCNGEKQRAVKGHTSSSVVQMIVVSSISTDSSLFISLGCYDVIICIGVV